MKNFVHNAALGVCALVSAGFAAAMISSGPREVKIIHSASATAPATTVPSVQRNPQAATAQCHVTPGNYERLKNGMSYSEVSEIFGCGGTEINRIEISDLHVSYMWDVSGGGFTLISFKNDGLTDKSWHGGWSG